MMKPHLIPTFVATVFWISSGPANAQIAGTYEAFTNRLNAESWIVYDYADQKTYLPDWDSAGDGLNPDIFFTFASTSALDFYADDFSSGGAFVGDLATAGVDAVSCEFFVEDLDSFDYAEFFFLSASDNRYYFSQIILPDANGWDFAYVSLTQDDWYVLDGGALVAVRLTPQILSEITEIGFSFHPLNTPAANGKTVAVDNFTFYGAFVLPKLSTSAANGLFELRFDRRPGIRYSIQSSTDLTNWTLVPGQGLITGDAPYSMSKPIAADPQFFKVGIEDFLTPVPDVAAAISPTISAAAKTLK